MQKELSNNIERELFLQLWRDHRNLKCMKMWSAKWADKDDSKKVKVMSELVIKTNTGHSFTTFSTLLMEMLLHHRFLPFFVSKRLQAGAIGVPMFHRDFTNQIWQDSNKCGVIFSVFSTFGWQVDDLNYRKMYRNLKNMTMYLPLLIVLVVSFQQYRLLSVF